MELLRFLANLDRDLKQALLAQLKIIWTYSSNSIEGNSLSLGETQFIIEEGLTIAGKTIREHNEVIGHVKAIDLIYSILTKESFTQEDLFALHTAIQSDIIIDAYNPIGKWKKEENGRNIRIDNKMVYKAYPKPEYIEYLMELWFTYFRNIPENENLDKLIETYAHLHIAFVSIHPFFDGNGRLARLVSNIPLLKAGYPPITINKEDRLKYLEILRDYQLSAPELNLNTKILLDIANPNLKRFVDFCREQYKTIQDTIESINKIQQERNRTNPHPD